MSKSLLGYHNIPDRDDTSVTGSGFKGGFPVGNLTHSHIGKFTQINGSSATIKVDAGVDVAARLLAFIGTDVTTSVSYTLTVDPDGGSFGAGATATRTSLSVDMIYEQALDDFGSDITGRYWQIDLTTSDTDRKIGRLVIAPANEFFLAYPVDFQTEDGTLVKETEGGQLLRFTRPQTRKANFAYNLTGANARADALTNFNRTVDRLAGKREDVLLVPDPGDSDMGLNQMIWGQLTNLGSASVSRFQDWEKSYTIKEVR